MPKKAAENKKRKKLYAVVFSNSGGDWSYLISEKKLDCEEIDLIAAAEEGLVDPDDDYFETEDVGNWENLEFYEDEPPKFITTCTSESSDHYYDLTDENIKKYTDVIEKVVRPYLDEEADYIDDVYFWPYNKEEHVYTKKEIKDLMKKYKAWEKSLGEE